MCWLLRLVALASRYACLKQQQGLCVTFPTSVALPKGSRLCTTLCPVRNTTLCAKRGVTTGVMADSENDNLVKCKKASIHVIIIFKLKQ